MLVQIQPLASQCTVVTQSAEYHPFKVGVVSSSLTDGTNIKSSSYEQYIQQHRNYRGW